MSWIPIGPPDEVLETDPEEPTMSYYGRPTTGIGWSDGIAIIISGEIVGLFTENGLATSNPLVEKMTFVIDGGGVVIPVGAAKAMVRSPYAATIERWSILADQPATMTLDVWKDTYANFPPDNTDSIVASDKPTTSAAQKAEGTALTDWDVSISEGDVLMLEVEANDLATYLVLDLWVRRAV